MGIIKVNIFVQPTAYCDPSKSWMAAMNLIEKRIANKTEIRVQFTLIELFSPESFSFPQIYEMLQQQKAETPIIMINGTIVQTGGKLSERIIREGIENEVIKLQHVNISKGE